MFTDEDIAEVMVAEIGYVIPYASRTLCLSDDNGGTICPQQPVVHRPNFTANRPSWPESETYPSARGKSGRMGSK